MCSWEDADHCGGMSGAAMTQAHRLYTIDTNKLVGTPLVLSMLESWLLNGDMWQGGGAHG
jgi:hypothetical protein